VRDQRHAPAALNPWERAGTHCTGGWVGPGAGLDRGGKSLSTSFETAPKNLSGQKESLPRFETGTFQMEV